MSVSCSLIPRVTHKSLGMRLVSKYTFKIASLGQYCMQFLNGFPQLSIVCEKKKKKKKTIKFTSFYDGFQHTIRAALHSLLVEDTLLLQALQLCTEMVVLLQHTSSSLVTDDNSNCMITVSGAKL